MYCTHYLYFKECVLKHILVSKYEDGKMARTGIMISIGIFSVTEIKSMRYTMMFTIRLENALYFKTA